VNALLAFVVTARKEPPVSVKHFVFGITLLASTATATFAAQGDAYPTRPVRIVVPSSPGGGLDFIGRVIGVRLTTKWGQQVIVDNRAGAGGMIGTDIVAKAQPDGYTLLIASADFAAMPYLYEKLPYDAADLAPITIIGSAPFVLVAHPSASPKTLKELIAAAKDKPGQLAFASSGVGTSSHLAMMLVRSMAGIDMVHVPYKGAGPAAAAAVSGEAPYLITSTGAVVPFIKGNRLRAIAVTSATRAPVLPEVPTIAEAGIPGYELSVWFGMMAPAKTPKTLIDKIYADVAEAIKTPELNAQLQGAGFVPGGMPPAAFEKIIKTDMQKLQKVIKEAGIKAE
jgi:tripartite-type tricarboxylate transporter receptor subunit TctC